MNKEYCENCYYGYKDKGWCCPRPEVLLYVSKNNIPIAKKKLNKNYNCIYFQEKRRWYEFWVRRFI